MLEKTIGIGINQFIKWQAENPNTCVDIKIEKGKVSIWVYDYSLMHGMFVNSVDEIDILADQKKEDVKILESIKRRHGGIYDDVVIPVAPGVDINLGNGVVGGGNG